LQFQADTQTTVTMLCLAGLHVFIHSFIHFILYKKADKRN